MARMWLLNAQQEDIPAICIEAEPLEEKARRLRETAKRLHGEWLADGSSASKRRRFARALKAWGRFVEDRAAVQHAEALLDPDWSAS